MSQKRREEKSPLNPGGESTMRGTRFQRNNIGYDTKKTVNNSKERQMEKGVHVRGLELTHKDLRSHGPQGTRA